jgi:3-hydroxybutyryl-CoA dehydrogenase
MGAGLARLFVAAGHDVAVFDERTEAAAAVAAQTPGVRAAATLAEAVGDAELCVEAIIEDLEAKRALFARLAELAPPDALLATNTSALLVADVAEAVPPAARSRVLGAHFFNPPDVVPAVEVVKARETDPDAVRRVAELLTAAGKVAAVVADTPGFVANRIQHAMIVEAWRCLEEGVGTAEDIDKVVSGSFGFRLFAYGPFQLGDFNGLDVYRSVMETLRDAYGDRFAPPPTLVERVQRGELGVKSGAGVFDYPGDRGAQAVRRRDELLERLNRLRAEELAPDGP